MGESSQNYNLTILRSILLLFGAYTFSYILGLIFHESGHALAYAIVGIPNIRIHVHPFALSYCSSGFRPPEVLPFTGSMGPILNLICSSIITLSLWHKRNPKLLPLLMCAGTAYISEGIGIVIDIVDLPLMTDWGKVMIIGGVSPIIIGIIGVVFMIIGSIIFLLLMPLQNISQREVFWKRISITTSISGYFLLSVIYTSIFDVSILEWRLIAFFSSIGFSVLLTAVYKPIFPYLDRLSHTETTPIPRSAISIALGSALGIIIIVLIFF